MIRVVGVCGVSGASLLGFSSDGARVDAEKRLVGFVGRQKALAATNQWALVVVGDLNSVSHPPLDV